MSVVTYYPGYSQVQVHENYLIRTISSITNANPMVVTTSVNHGYQPGLNVSFLIPSMFGMQQLNGKSANILSVTSNTLTVNLDSSKFSAFSYPAQLPIAYSNPSVIPNASGPYLPPLPLPYGNQDSFQGTIYNAGIS
jgi:hypothetical protein